MSTPAVPAAPAVPKLKHKVVPLAEIVKRRGSGKRASYVVEGIIAEKSVNIGVGDSGIGKSPLAYQMGLCVASGMEFLGRAVRQGRVLYVDLENGEDQFTDIALGLQRHLNLPEIPSGFHVLTDRDDCEDLGSIIAEIRPLLVIIDSLRAYRPGAEEKNKDSAWLITTLKQLARQFGASFILLHHVKKPADDESVLPVHDTNVMDWLTLACGARSLINQTDTRIALGPCLTQKTGRKKGKDENAEAEVRDTVGLVMRWFERSRGQSAPFFLSRTMDEHGEPLGYQVMTGAELLFNDYMKDAWGFLPRGRDFTFTEAKEIYGRAAPATRNWLAKCIAVGIVRQAAKGAPYRVIE